MEHVRSKGARETRDDARNGLIVGKAKVWTARDAFFICRVEIVERAGC